MSADIREKTLSLMTDMVADLLYYDRKEDEEMGPGQIESAVRTEPELEREIVAAFAAALHRGLTGGRRR